MKDSREGRICSVDLGSGEAMSEAVWLDGGPSVPLRDTRP